MACATADHPADLSPLQREARVTYEDLARDFDVSLVTVRSWVKDGRLPAPIKLGQKRFWLRSTLDEFLRRAATSREREVAHAS
jgi:predicted DNA-binding transcriptional regulator AlpA